DSLGLVAFLGRHRRQTLLESFLRLHCAASFNAAVDTDGAAGNPIETHAVLTGDIGLGPDSITAKSVGINCSETDEKGECYRTDSDAANQLFRESQLAAQEPIDSGAYKWEQGD